ncbi:hemerythrin domain-containing protein [Streptomyces sp. NPDC048279]|uniref:hemerythrin domain-containing protein n=1 Tax=Streptomyces sp. NPDC048279 TaxID=3154714 RepID=UPI003427EBBA
MNQVTGGPMADVRDMYMVHAMLRREFRLLPQLVRDVAPGIVKRAEVVATHAEFVCRLLHLHHEGEDLLLWPLLLTRGGEKAASIVPAMEEQHKAIHEAYGEVTALLPAWRSTARGAEALAGALERLLTTLEEHLETEEEEILPLATKYVTAAEWKRLGEHGMANSPKKTLPLAFGMTMYEGKPEVVRAVLAEAPLPARLIISVVGPRLYAAHAKRVHGTRKPPRIGT